VPAGAQVAVPAEKPLPPGVRLLEITGGIAPALVPKMRHALESSDPTLFPAGAIVLLDSQGGDGLAAMEIGRMIRAAKAHVFVVGRCASACVYLLASGVVRGVARDGAIGIHRARLSAFVKGLGIVDINSESNPKAAAALELGNRQTQEYYRDMGMPDALFPAMMAAPWDKTRYLDLAELPGFGLTGVDPAYWAERVPAGAARYGISEDEFERRAAAVGPKCLAGDAPSRTFVRCYRQLMARGD
jgi:hypothetical protein